MNWEKYIGKTVSVLIVGKEDKEENYIGRIEEISDDYMVLNTDEVNDVISEITFKTNLIKSIWIYKKYKKKKKPKYKTYEYDEIKDE